MHQKHDRAYHRLFSEPALVEDLMRNFVQEPWVAQLGFVMRLENADTHEDFQAALDELVDTLPAHLFSLKRAFSIWITHVIALHKGIRLDPKNIEDLEEVRDMLSARVEQWEHNILQEGIEQGIEKGKTTLLIKMLELKYGPLPQWAQEKIAGAKAATIEQWAANLLKAKTLEEIFDL